MYNAHRGIPPAPSSRLTELLDQVRQEFDNQQSRTGEYEQNSKFATLRESPKLCLSCFYIWPCVTPRHSCAVNHPFSTV